MYNTQKGYKVFKFLKLGSFTCIHVDVSIIK